MNESITCIMHCCVLLLRFPINTSLHGATLPSTGVLRNLVQNRDVQHARPTTILASLFFLQTKCNEGHLFDKDNVLVVFVVLNVNYQLTFSNYLLLHCCRYKKNSPLQRNAIIRTVHHFLNLKNVFIINIYNKIIIQYIK